MSKLILVVDDDELLRHGLATSLEQAGYQVQMAESAEAALEMIHAARPDLVLLDIGLPGMDGREVLRHIPKSVPVIFVTGYSDTNDEVLGLELGARDFISKPFSLNVLLARIRIVLRRAQPAARPEAESTALRAGDLMIDLSSHSVTVAKRPVTLTPLEFRLLHRLALHAGKVLATGKLLDSVWGPEYAGESQILYVCMRALREKIEEDPQQPCRLLTVRGVGYKYMPQESTVGCLA